QRVDLFSCQPARVHMGSWLPPCTNGWRDVFAGVDPTLSARVRCAVECAHLSRAAPALPTMPDNRVKSIADTRVKDRRRAGRPPAGAKEGEKVKDYPQLSIRVPIEFKARLNALSAVTGLAQPRSSATASTSLSQVRPPTGRERVAGLSEPLMKAT